MDKLNEFGLPKQDRFSKLIGMEGNNPQSS